MKTNKLSIKTAITTIAGVAILIGIIYVTYLSNKNFEKIIVSQTQQKLLTISKATATSLDNFFIEHLEALAAMSKNPLLQEMAYEKKRCIGCKKRFCPIRNLYEAHKKDADALTLLDNNGIMLHRSPFIADRIGMDLTDKPGVAYVLRKRKPNISKVFYNNNGNLAVSILEPIFYKDKFVGIARWMIEIDRISKRFVEPVKVGKKGFVWMFNNKNIVISHPKKDFIGMSVLDVVRKTHKGKNKIFDESQIQEHIREKHDHLNRVKIKEEGGVIFTNVTRGNDLVAYKRVQLGNATFNLIVTLPYSEIIDPINKHAIKIFGLAGFVIILLGAGGLVLFRMRKKKVELETEAKYLKEIAESAEALKKARDELEIRVEERTFELSAVNKKLRVEIAEREQAKMEIRKLNKELEERVIARTKELEEKNKELERINKLFVGRELRIKGLKEKIKSLQGTSDQ